MRISGLNRFLSLILLLLFEEVLLVQVLSAQVKVYEGKETIHTYRLGPDEVSPIFYTGRNVQGAAGHYYPYPAQISLGEVPSDVIYDMVYLENQYLKVTILPALGGRILSAIDKTNGHEVFHRNSVIKPDLIGTLGAWVSGGIEWCFPHHHRTSTFMPADYRIVENEDGSATVWIGETEKSLRLRGVVGITLHPGRSYIDVVYRLNNPNPVTRNFKFWANVAVTADENFRTFWPPDQEIGVFHNNSSFTHWPISTEIYRGIDYSKGVDLTWWKNHPSPVSFFFWQAESGFIGGYDYSQKAGMVHIGDTYKSRTSKLWQFGPGLEGQNARRKLTDDGKAYVELMTGTFSNNQPDYSWFSPHSVKDARHYWYPLRDIEMAKNANKDAAVTLQMRDKKTVFYGFNSSGSFNDARVVLSYDDVPVVTRKIDIDPANPFTATWQTRKEIDEYRLRVALMDEHGAELISYSPKKPLHPELPEEFERVKSPKEIKSIEDLYLTGRFVEQFSRPYQNADDYYLEALERSPGDYRVNMALGVRRVKQWKYAEAEEYLQKAAVTLRAKYIQPQEGELYYYLALAQRARGKFPEAYRNFHLGTYDYAWYSPGYYQLAQMESGKGNYSKALEFIEDAYSTNMRDGGIVVLYSALLRKFGRTEEARELVNRLLIYDPLNFAALYELEQLGGNVSLAGMHQNMQDPDNNYLEIATNYYNAGLYYECISLLEGLENPASPLIDYYLAHCYAQTDQMSDAKNALSLAGTKSLAYCFPFRPETEEVLRFAAENDTESPNAFYLLGNLLYDNRPEEAIQAWISSTRINGELPMVWRNLAFGSFHNQKDVNRAIEYQQKAINAAPENPIWYAELFSYYEASERDFRECLEILESHIDIVRQNVTAPKNLVRLYNLNGDYDKSIDLLGTHHFRTWEGGRDIYWHYVDAHTLSALRSMQKGNYQEALGNLEKAMLYPENLEVGKPLNDEMNALILYAMGMVFEKMKESQKARDCFEKCTGAVNTRSWPDLEYYQGLAHLKMGNTQKAEGLFDNLIREGRIKIESSENLPKGKVVSEGYFLQALGEMGKGNVDKARNLLEQSVEAYSYNLWARYYLEYKSDN